MRITPVLTTSVLVQTGLVCLRLSTDTNRTARITKTPLKKRLWLMCFFFFNVMMEIRASSFVCRVQCLGKKQWENPADHRDWRTMHAGRWRTASGYPHTGKLILHWYSVLKDLLRLCNVYFFAKQYQPSFMYTCEVFIMLNFESWDEVIVWWPTLGLTLAILKSV